MTGGPVQSPSTRELRVFLYITAASLFIACADVYRLTVQRAYLASSIRYQVGLGGLLLGGFVTFALAGVLTTKFGEVFRHWLFNLQRWISSIGRIRIPVLLLMLCVPPGLFLLSTEEFMASWGFRAFISWLAIFTATVVFTSSGSHTHWPSAAIGLSVLFGILHRLSLLSLDITAYPFSLGWSETSRYYYASLFFSHSLYGIKLSPSVLHPTRYLMQSIPFILPSLPLWFHRTWQVVLWLGTTSLTGFFLSKRLEVESKLGAGIVTVFTVLYLFQGPVYYHLLVMVILILWGFDRHNNRRNTVVVLVASLWAGISRLNWYPVPAMLMITLYLLEVHKANKTLGRYFAWPALWGVVGMTAALVSQFAYVAWSGNPADQFSSSLTSDLLWYRLFPNATYSLGILSGILLASLPLSYIFIRARKLIFEGMHWSRSLSLLAMVAVLLFGGIVVSVKIGGGSNLHNLDAYLVLIGIIAAYIFSGRVVWESPIPDAILAPGTRAQAFLILIPLMLSLTLGQPRDLPERTISEGTLITIRDQMNEVERQPPKVLMISQRHLYPFGYIQNVEVEHAYETVFLMEMAMAGNAEYLAEFHENLSSTIYDLIIVHPLDTRMRTRADDFTEEDNAWIQQVAIPILCHYEVSKTFGEDNIQLFTPRDSSCSQ